MSDPETVVAHLRRAFLRGTSRSYEWRVGQLTRFLAMMTENELGFCEALKRDLNRCYQEALCYEVNSVKNEINGMLKNLNVYMSNERVRRNVGTVFDRAYIQKEPLGVVLIMGSWNYPVQVSLAPLAGAIAAGNCAVIKPSEIASHSAAFIAELLPKYLDSDCYRVFQGGVTETTELLKQRFDHIMLTGSVPVGRIVMTAAAKHLTPVTLELGGKCPVFLDVNCDLRAATKRITWGKFVSSGQTCLAPDYLLCPKEIEAEVIKYIVGYLNDFYGEDALQSPDFSRVITEQHTERLVALLDGAEVAYGGKYDVGERYLQPTILRNVKASDRVMQDEIFGPILPIVSVNSLDEAIEFVVAREKPLAKYIFSNSDEYIQKVLNTVSSGGVTINDCILHFALDTLPFGGVGNSGMGRYHGKYSFDTFTHEKSVLHCGFLNEKLVWMRYPPFDSMTERFGRVVSTAYPLPYVPRSVWWLLLGLLLGYALSQFSSS